MTKEKFKKSLACILTERELLDYSKELAKFSQDKEGVEKKKKEVNDDLKAQITKLDADIGMLSRKIGSGYEYRDIECYWSYSWETRLKHLVRVDSGEIVQTKEIENSEKQTDLGL